MPSPARPRTIKSVTWQCLFVMNGNVATKPSQADIEISAPFFRVNGSASSARYRWNCHDRGEAPFVILQWTHSGEGVFENRQGVHRIPADHAFVAIVPERSRYYYPEDRQEPWIFSWLNLYGSFACDLCRAFQARFGPVVALTSRGGAAAALRRLLTMAEKPDPLDRSRVSLQAYAFILEWAREAAAPSGRSENGLDRAVQFCRLHFREPLGVKEIAQQAGMSREHFSRVFAQDMRQPPAAFLRNLRVIEAAMLLRETELPLREIAMRSGFYSTRHLMRTFQRIHRVGPSEYRRRKAPRPSIRSSRRHALAAR
jgi:AraC family transcriptional regulator of arabinose operon